MKELSVELKAKILAKIEKRLDFLYKKLPDASKVELGDITTEEAAITGGYTELESMLSFINSLPEEYISEDEKIRKELIKTIEQLNPTHYFFDSFPKENVIAWLEKQKFTKPTDIKTWKYIVDAVLTEREGIGQYIDSPFTEEVAKKLQKRFGNIEQKPAWSEEDENWFKEIELMARSFSCDMDYQAKFFKWLKSLKDRVQPKPVQEWNGSDDAHLHSIITHLQDFIESHPNTTGADIQGENVAWLESLRPQNHWKPSEEQIEALDLMIDCCIFDEYNRNKRILLKELLRQLKQL